MHICNSCRCRRGGFQSEIIKGIVASRHIFTPSFFLLLGNLTNLVTFFTDYSARVHWWSAQCAKSFSSVSLRPGCQTQEVSFLSGRVRLSCVIDARKSNSVYVPFTRGRVRQSVIHAEESTTTQKSWKQLFSEIYFLNPNFVILVMLEPNKLLLSRIQIRLSVLSLDLDPCRSYILIQIRVPAK